jgi:hypothetical protein
VAEQSIRFDRARGTDLRGYTPGGDESAEWTMSWWMKITGDLGVNRVIWEARLDANNFTRFELNALNQPIFRADIAGVTEATFGGQRFFVDVSNWMHFHFTFNPTFLQFSINGYGYPTIQQIPFSSASAIPGYVWLSAVEHFIGGDGLSADRASIQMAEMHCVGGTTAARTSFGVFNANGVWERIPYVGTHGARGFHLTFGRTIDLGEDFSGNNNDFTVHTNAAGGGADQFNDWIEKNYCTLDVNDQRTTGTITEGGLVVAGGVAAVTMRPDFGVWYYERNGVAVVFDTGVSGQFDPLLTAATYNFGQLPFVDVGPMGGELTLNSNNFPATATDNARDSMAGIEYAGDDATPKVITLGTGQSTIYDIAYADITHRVDLLWVKGSSPLRNWFQAHRLRVGTQIPINQAGAEESVNALGVITDLPDPGPGFEVTAGATDLENLNKFGNEYNALSLRSKNYSQNIPTAVDSDDAEEIQPFPGVVDIGSSDLELNSEGDSAGTEQEVGFRFLNVQIPKDSTIIDARIQFEADEIRTTTPCDVEIFCQAADNPPTFVAVNGNISTRAKTSGVKWTNVPGWVAVQDRLAAQLTPNFAAAVQEVVDRAGWVAGNAMVVVITHDQASANFERRTAEGAGSGTPLDAHEPMLQLTWRRPGAEAETGVSLFDYTGVGKVADVMHGNQAVPDLIAIKRADAGTDWNVYIGSTVTAGAPETGRYSFNNTGAFLAALGNWNDTAPGAIFVTLGTSSRVNIEGSEYVGFALSNVRGFLQVFRYVGNNSLNGPEVYLGFKPRWLCIKRTQVAANWVTMHKATDIIGAQNNQFNLMDSMGFLNTDDNFFQNIGIEAYSNGFKIRDLDAAVNAAGAEYVGWAFAEASFPNAKATH